ncbi:MAG TPA: penicillin-binding transpeptidase domain-containing protein [Solirubrobacteraceae bacterium]|nr:penicillin-binding transpeptidase domain-containing protein [Solirubrobacteraceae bacterium]
MSTRRPARSKAPRRVQALVAAGIAAFGVGLVCGATHETKAQKAAKAFARAWGRDDTAGMYRALSPDARRRYSLTAFRNAYRATATTATASAWKIGKARGKDDTFRIPVHVTTRIFGAIDGQVTVRASDAGVDWQPYMAFPGLRVGDHLTRVTKLPPRAELLARDGTPFTKLPDIAPDVVGDVGPMPADDVARLTALGYPADAQVGVSGLQRFLQADIGGRPGGDLLAGGRLLAHSEPRQARPVRTTISPSVERAAIAALAGRLGGVVAVRPRSGQILAFAGIAFSGLQPPGSTMKMVTLTGVLDAKVATPKSTFPYQTATTLSGVQLSNANGESCGGTLAQAFATSCNSVFAPLGAKLGAKRLVDIAERFGFNHDPGIPGAATSTIPPASDIGDDLAVGSSAIGQGRVQASTLQMVRVASTIALGGREPKLTLALPARPHAAPTTRVVSAKVAHTVRRLMVGVVRGGTGVRAQIAGVEVAGKTGTAELETTQKCPAPDSSQQQQGDQQPIPESCQNAASRTDDTDAWFAAFAPARKPRIAVCVMLVRNGAGGDTAAPAARSVLIAGLR